MDLDASQMEDQSEARDDIPDSRVVRRSIFESDFVGGITIGVIYLLFAGVPSMYHHSGLALTKLTRLTFGTFFRLFPFTPLLFGKRPARHSDFGYLHLFPFCSRWLAALRLGPFPTGASLRNYIQNCYSKTYNVSHVSYELRAGTLHFYVPSWVSYGSRVTPLDMIRRAKLYVPNFDSIRVD